MRCSSIVLLPFLLLAPCLGAEEAVLPKSVQKAEADHAEDLSEIIEKAEADIAKSKEKLIKTLEQEIKYAERKNNVDIAAALHERLKSLKSANDKIEYTCEIPDNRKAAASLFGMMPDDNKTIALLKDDAGIYKWKNGVPEMTSKIKSEGTHAFIPTGNNHTYFDEPYIIGKGEGRVAKIAFDIYLADKTKVLIFQAQINNSWNNRVSLDGREHYAGQFKWPQKKTIPDIPTGEWQTIEIDFKKDLNAPEGAKLGAMAFSAVASEALTYDHVRLIAED